MFFMLSHRVVGKKWEWEEDGIVVADSVQEAATKIGATIVESEFSPPGQAWAELENDYWLQEYGEVTTLPNSSGR